MKDQAIMKDQALATVPTSSQDDAQRVDSTPDKAQTLAAVLSDITTDAEARSQEGYLADTIVPEGGE